MDRTYLLCYTMARKTEKEQHLLIKLFMKALNCDEELAQILIDKYGLEVMMKVYKEQQLLKKEK